MNTKQKKITFKSAGLLVGALVVLVSSAFLVGMGGGVALADANYCKQQYPIPKDASANAVEHASEQQAACRAGYNKKTCDSTN